MAVSMQEVAKHTTKEDCWVCIHDKVYDVTKWLPNHPGGELALLTFAGKDATEEFDMIHPPDTIEKHGQGDVILMGPLGGSKEDTEYVIAKTKAKEEAVRAMKADPNRPTVGAEVTVIRNVKQQHSNDWRWKEEFVGKTGQITFDYLHQTEGFMPPDRWLEGHMNTYQIEGMEVRGEKQWFFEEEVVFTSKEETPEAQVAAARAADDPKTKTKEEEVRKRQADPNRPTVGAEVTVVEVKATEAKEQYLAVFDALASNGALKPKEFAIVMQMEIVQNLKKNLAMGEQMARSMASPLPSTVIDDIMPILTRAINRMDTSHLRKVLELLFKVLDSNKNNQIERDEFQAIWDIGSSMDPTRIADLFFRTVDVNENGKISCDEAQTLFTCLSEIVSTLLASGADILDSVVRSPQVTDVVVKAAKECGGQLSKNTRAEIAEQVEAMAPMIKAQLEAAPSDQTKQIMDMVQMLRDSMARFEENVGARFYMAAMEFSAGGVDESTFIAKVVPIVVQNQKDELAKHGNDPLKLMGSYPGISEAQAKYPEPMKQALEELAKSDELKPALLRGWERSQEYIPEMVRAMFRLIDLDDSGTISSQEITLLRAILDGMIHLGQRAVADPNDPAQRLEGSFEDNMKALALAIFDAIDRNGDGELNLEELVKFGQKYVSFILEMIVGYSHMMIECMVDEVGKVIVSTGFKKSGIEEVDKEQIMGMVQMAPMLAMQAPMILAQMQAGA